MTCDPPRFCCKSGDMGDQGCQAQCLSDNWIMDGDADCIDGSDEQGNSLLN